MVFRSMGTRAVLLLAAALPAARAQQGGRAPGAMDGLIAEHHYLRARPLVEAALENNRADVHALVQRSVLEWAFFRFDAAIATAERAVSLAGGSAEAHTQLTNALGAKLISSGASTFEKMGMARRFRKEAELSVQLDPNSLDALEDLSRFFWNAPALVGGDKAKARELAERAGRLDPARGAGLKAEFAGDEKDAARRNAARETAWKAAVAARPESADAHLGLSEVYFDEGAGGYNLAESEARRAVALKPSLAGGYRQLAVLYATAGRWEELDALVKQARAAVPDDLSPAYQAAKTIVLRNATGQLGRAERYLRSYLAQPAEGEAPTHAAAHWRLGLVLEKLGKRGEAVEELQAAVREDGSLEGARKDLKRLS